MNVKAVAAYLIIGLLIGVPIGYGITYLMTPQTETPQDGLSGNIVVKGSDTLLIVAQLWAENFSNQNPDVRIDVAGGGSGVGFTALKDKTTDICDASREIKDSEVDACKANGVDPVEWVVGLDGIAIVVHPSNPINELTLEQLELIYNGTYTNWNQVGGNDASIVKYGRQSTSGTYAYFREHVLHNRDFVGVNELAGNADIANNVQNDANGIGYVGVAYTQQGVNIKVLNIKPTASSEAYPPSVANIKSGAYPIARKLYIYTNGIPSGVLGAYISFIVGSQGQQVLESEGYVSYVKTDK
jgi:phosphate transport system substrate-binding protein